MCWGALVLQGGQRDIIEKKLRILRGVGGHWALRWEPGGGRTEEGEFLGVK